MEAAFGGRPACSLLRPSGTSGEYRLDRDDRARCGIPLPPVGRLRPFDFNGATRSASSSDSEGGVGGGGGSSSLMWEVSADGGGGTTTEGGGSLIFSKECWNMQ